MNSPLFFRIYKNNQIHVVKQFVNDERIVIGNGAGVQIDLQSPEVSSIHCLVERRDNGYYLCDLGSEQGTFVNGQQVLDQQIGSGDSFNVGPFQIFFMQGNQRNIDLNKAEHLTSPVMADPDARTGAPVAMPPPTEVVESTVTTLNIAAQNQKDVQQLETPAVPSSPPLFEKIATSAPADTIFVPPNAQPKPFEFKGPPITEPAPAPVVKAKVPTQPKVTVKANIPAEAVVAKKATPTAAGPTGLKDFVRVGSGSRVEVIVSWKERILNTYHFIEKGDRYLGIKGDVSVPDGSAPPNWKILSFTGNQLEVNVAPGMRVEVIRDGDLIQAQDNKIIIRESEVCFVELGNDLQLAIRFAPRAPLIALDSPFVLGISEFTGVLAALILAVITSLIVSVNKPKPENKDEEIERVAKIIFTKPPQPPPLVAETQPEVKPEPPKPEPPKKEPEIKKISLDEKKPTKNVGQVSTTPDKSSEKASSGKASEVKPKDPKFTKKMFTSPKSGAQVKTGETDGANLKAKEPDVKNTGLLSAFGSGGARNKLDKAYSGSGELLGAGEKATGTSGFKSNSAGEDLGSKAKDTGAGGTGTATQGIAGVGTRGRGTGNTGSDVSSGFGEKGKIQIAAGGNEEEFTGSIDKEAVRRVVKSALSQFKSCYEKEYRMNSRLEGKVVIQWEIHERGEAKNAKVVKLKSTINNPAVESCVRDRMMLLKFPEPPPGTAAEVTYPFIFQGQKL